jgi:ribosomal protein S18 acetylase RimI-like enzyme
MSAMDASPRSYTQSVEIRRARPDEWQAVRDLRLRALTSDPDAFGGTLEEARARTDAEWQARADHGDTAIFVAESTAGLVGMATGAPAPDRPTIAALFGMWVAPEARGQGIGTRLIDAVEDWARAAGYASIGLGVTTMNEPAIRLYTSKGYVGIGEHHPLRDGTDLTIQIMAKPLT